MTEKTQGPMCGECGALDKDSHMDGCPEFGTDPAVMPEWFMDPADSSGSPRTTWLGVEETAAVAEMLRSPERWRILREPERWRMLNQHMAGIPEPVDRHWTTCLMHAERDGTVYVCSRPADHMETAVLEGREAEEFHMDVNGSVYWSSPLNVQDIQPETLKERWRDWFYTGTLDPRSMGAGAVAVLLVVLIALVAWIMPR